MFGRARSRDTATPASHDFASGAMRAFLDARDVVGPAPSAVVGAIGLYHYPFSSENPLLALIRLERSLVYGVFAYTYANTVVSTITAKSV